VAADRVEDKATAAEEGVEGEMVDKDVVVVRDLVLVENAPVYHVANLSRINRVFLATK
jgi:hypothetical protein